MKLLLPAAVADGEMLVHVPSGSTSYYRDGETVSCLLKRPFLLYNTNAAAAAVAWSMTQ